MALTKQATWGHGTDPMELDMMQTTDKKKESWKCLQCEKARHICHNCCFVGGGNTLASLELGNKQGLGMKGAGPRKTNNPPSYLERPMGQTGSGRSIDQH